MQLILSTRNVFSFHKLVAAFAQEEIKYFSDPINLTLTFTGSEENDFEDLVLTVLDILNLYAVSNCVEKYETSDPVSESLALITLSAPHYIVLTHRPIDKNINAFEQILSETDANDPNVILLHKDDFETLPADEFEIKSGLIDRIFTLARPIMQRFPIQELEGMHNDLANDEVAETIEVKDLCAHLEWMNKFRDIICSDESNGYYKAIAEIQEFITKLLQNNKL